MTAELNTGAIRASFDSPGPGPGSDSRALVFVFIVISKFSLIALLGLNIEEM